MRRFATTPRSLALALCAVLLAATFAAPADAKRHRRNSHHHVAGSHRAASACRGTHDVPTPATAAAAQASTLCLVNNERLGHGLSPLAENPRLDQAAAGHSVDMVVNHFFEHISPTGSTLLSRVTRSGYAAPGQPWSAGENIAWGTGALGTPDAIVRAWMNSPGHRANILRSAFREVGTGVIAAAPVAGLTDPGGTYTQEFGARS